MGILPAGEARLGFDGFAKSSQLREKSEKLQN
jgi:hypothetical protein